MLSAIRLKGLTRRLACDLRRYRLLRAQCSAAAATAVAIARCFARVGAVRGLAVGPAIGAASKHPPGAAAAAAAAVRAPAPSAQSAPAAAAGSGTGDAAAPASAAMGGAARSRAPKPAAKAVRGRFAVPPPISPKPQVMLSAADFQLAVTQLYDTVSAGLADMAAVNDGFSVQRAGASAPTAAEPHVEVLTVAAGAAVGTFEFRADHTTQLVTVTSPISGLHHYAFDSTEQRFVDTVDTHILIDLFARDLLARCKGTVNF